MNEGGKALERIYSTFGGVASALGYSPIHGKIIAALVVNGGELSLQEAARETGYSISMVSLSLDLLEVMGVIRKHRKHGDRNMYIQLKGDLLGVLRDAIAVKIGKSVAATLEDLESARASIRSLPPGERERVIRAVDILEKEIRRLSSYVGILSKSALPDGKTARF